MPKVQHFLLPELSGIEISDSTARPFYWGVHTKRLLFGWFMHANHKRYLGSGGLPKGTSWMQNAMSICDLAASLGVQPSDHRPADCGKVLGATPCQKHLISIRENGLRSRFSGSRTPPRRGGWKMSTVQHFLPSEPSRSFNS